MQASAIHYLDPIIKVLYNKDNTIRSFLTQDQKGDYTLFMKEPGCRWYYNKSLRVKELEEIKELLRSPIEKIDLDELQKF